MLNLVRSIPSYLPRILRWDKIQPCLLFASIPALVLFGVSLLVLTSHGFEIMQVLRDPAQQTDTSSFLGFLSNIGIWLWVSAAAISYFTSLTMEQSRIPRHRELLILLAMFSTVLAIDDFFMIHERYVNQWLCYAIYVIVAVLLFLRHHESIVRIDGFSFLLALFFLGSSIATDTVQGRIGLAYADTQVVEEGLKFMGAGTWLYFVGLASLARGESRPSV